MSDRPDQVHLAIALDGAGAHPAAWRVDDARANELLTARYWADVVGQAEAGFLDFVTLGDSFLLQDSSSTPIRTDRLGGRLDALLIAARVAPLTKNVGLIPTANVPHTEPFHLSKAVATLDYVSGGRAGIGLSTSPDVGEAALFGRRDVTTLTPDTAADEAADYANVLRLLWDSWEDGAEIRDTATGRFIDRDKLHYVDFAGEYFSIRGPSITPRPPQGQPLVAIAAYDQASLRLAGEVGDVAFIAPDEITDATTAIASIRHFHDAAGRPEEDRVHVFVDLTAVLGESTSHAIHRKHQLDELDGAEYSSALPLFAGSADDLAEVIAEWTAVPGISGVRLHPATHAFDLPRIGAQLVPELQRHNLFRTSYDDSTLRDRLGLLRPENRFTARQKLTLA
ncbi:putative oxidoreductase [Gordonia effusa NBRC 100432]|uniref:Putative oxidoreductase n=1 Tax=Gordonia effusa NBRC 100432 TaxID=1077974 RepID=H0R5N6_9ACTN|nr:LLM class flavin-dependent oxidoreductase [Gordonia effusa]GAB20387.1 putative oxidoreductase [Gordonia effusa NBRC 100432]